MFLCMSESREPLCRGLSWRGALGGAVHRWAMDTTLKTKWVLVARSALISTQRGSGGWGLTFC